MCTESRSRVVLARIPQHFLTIFLGVFLSTACVPPPQKATHTTATEQTPVAAPRADTFRQTLDEVIQMTLRQRRLNTVDHGAWQILHGVLAFQGELPLEIGRGGPLKPALDYAMSGGEVAGWTFEPGDRLPGPPGRIGLRAIVEPGTKKGQGHPDQWLSIMSQCDVPIEQSLVVRGRTYSLRDLIDQIKLDVPYNANREWSWTMTGLGKYLPITERWTARDGQTWDFERLLQAEIEQDIDDSACGGTHRLSAIATTIKRHRAAGGQMEGVWLEAEEIVKTYIERALAFQNPDGSFAANYLRRPGTSSDLGLLLATTGHVLEFLTIAMTDEQLRQPQVARAAQYLCDLLRETRDMPLECGGLYHGVHGLILYRQRIFGPYTYRFAEPVTTTAQTD